MSAEDNMFRELGEQADAFIALEEDNVRRYAEGLLSRVPAKRLNDIDLMWWAAAVKIALEEPLQRFEVFLDTRQNIIQDTFDEMDVPIPPIKALALTGVGDVAAGIDRKTRESIVAGLRGTDLVEAIRNTVEAEILSFIRNLDSIFSVHDRIVFRELGRDLDAEFWVYAGPADERNRPFCADIVRRDSVFTDSGIDKLNDHPLLHSYVPPNVSVLCGGHGCRHVWLPVQEAGGRTIES